MKKAIATLALVSALGVAGPARAQGGGGSGGGAGSSTPVSEGHWNRVQSVDAQSGTIVVEGEENPLKVDKSTQVSRDGVKTSMDDVHPGDEVRAAYLTGKHEGPITQLDVRSRSRSTEGGSSGDTDKKGSSSK